jgi:hypothetical protein
MRNLQRNMRSLYYAHKTGTERAYDEYGNETLEEKILYSPPLLLRCNISANAGQEAVEVFGSMSEYSRTISFSGDSCPLSEGDRIWFGIDPNTDSNNFNYVVARVADSKNFFLVALREVTNHA